MDENRKNYNPEDEYRPEDAERQPDAERTEERAEPATEAVASGAVNPEENLVDPALELPEIPATQADQTTSAAQASTAAEPEQLPEKGRSGWKSFVAAIALVAVGAGVGSATTFALARQFLAQQPAPVSYVQEYTSPGAKAVADLPFADSNVIPSVYRKASPGVVKIKAQARRGLSRGSTGSGFVVDSRGYILTNYHVIEGTTTIQVHFIDGTVLEGSVVGSDRYQDLAVVKVDPGNRSLVTLPLGDSDKVEVGELAIAIGSPFDQDYTVTAGIVSGVNRSIQEENNPFDIKGAIQTDAAINPGNSGGPLLNAAGEVIGINTAIESPLRGSVGVGFAVPVNSAKKILPTLIAGKKVEYPWLGVGLNTMSPDLAKVIDSSAKTGSVVVSVYKESPAEKAGLKSMGLDRFGNPVSADVIIAVDGTAVKNAEDLIDYLQSKKVGDTISLTVVRGSQTLELQATLAPRPDTIE